MQLEKQENTDLEKWLASPIFKGQAMRLDKLQGFLCAVISSPDLIPASSWVVDALGDEPEYDSLDQAKEFMGLLMQFYNQIASTLNQNQALRLILKPVSETDKRLDYQTWCEGYILGWGLSQQEWLRPGNEALKKLTFPILFLSGAFKEDAEEHGKEYLAIEEERQVWQDCADLLPQAVREIYDFWLSRRKAMPVIRDAPKMGRNDPCDCGSGKKYKLCCGAPGRLH